MDTGSKYLIIDDDLARKLRIPVDPLTYNHETLFSANGTKIIVTGTIHIYGLIVYHTVKVAANITHLFIEGRDFLWETHAVIDYSIGKITFEDGSSTDADVDEQPAGQLCGNYSTAFIYRTAIIV